MAKNITVALAGNPNAGKTTLFNNLTGARQHVGNYPGVTVEKKEGSSRYKGVDIRIVDLPGTYSLTAYSLEEVAARDFIIDQKPDVVVDVVDASNLERNLYLAVQIMELGAPLVLAFNMADVARARGIEFDLDRLSRLLGAPIVPTVGHKGLGMDDLLEAVVSVADGGMTASVGRITYGDEIEKEIAGIEPLLSAHAAIFCDRYSPRWLALKLLEGDREVRQKVDAREVLTAVDRRIAHLENVLGDPPEVIIADRRYGFISGACREAVRSTVAARHTMSDRIDAVLTNRVLGLPIFLGLMYGVFWLTFTAGGPPMDWIDGFFGRLGQFVSGWWPVGSESLLKSLLVDAVIGGVGGVLVFLPNILLLFLAIALLEDSGYMARAAFIMDKMMHKIGLHGKSFIPLLLGFGCTIPAIMATRTIENRRDRLTTMLVAPLMSCGARLPIYVLIIPAFFPKVWQAPMLWIIYVIGVLLAVAVAKLLRGTLFKGETAPFVMELPPYRMPTLEGVLIHMGERAWLFMRKAGTIILGVSVLLWMTTTFPQPPETTKDRFETKRLAVQGSSIAEEEKRTRLLEIDDREAEARLEYSIAGRIGHALAPVFTPIGFDWKLVTPVIGAIAAKEVFVAQLGVVFSVGEADEQSRPLRTKLRQRYTPLTGFCILLFMLVVAPCMATFAVLKSESGSWRWANLQFWGLTVLAYVLTLIVYQIGYALRIGVGT